MKSFALLILVAVAAHAQLTPDQKEFDLRAMATAYSKHYAPIQWKKDLLGFDLLDLQSWVQRARATRDDLEFMALCAEYVASLEDTHSSFIFPTSFTAVLPLHLDIYDGRLLVDQITRTLLPADRFPFQIGDEVVEFDGQPAAEALDEIARISNMANPRARLRRAAQRLTARAQSSLPLLPRQIGVNATLRIRRAAGGAIETYQIPWIRSGTPTMALGAVPSPPAPRSPEPADDLLAPWIRPLRGLHNESVPLELNDVLGYGSFLPVWTLPAGFQQRAAVNFLSGTFTADGLRIGFLRIPSFAPPNTTTALQEFEREIAFMQQNTDGLIIDVMRNNGGSACYNEEIQRRLIPYRFQAMAREIRATLNWVVQFSETWEAARAFGAPASVVAQARANFNEILTTYSENGGRTGPMPICSESLWREPADIVYTKPLMVLMDEWSTSAADAFPAVLQDAQRGPMFGYRSNGAGGTTSSVRFGAFSSATASNTIAMHYRVRNYRNPGYPESPYVENIGVHPDIPFDYMTRDNLMANGRLFVEAFTRAMVQHIRR